MSRELRFIVGLAVMAGITYLLRVLPMVFIKKKITNTFICSFLYYVPYTVLSVMTFPTVLYCTGSYYSGIAATAVCILLSYLGRGMMTVALGGVGTVIITEVIERYLIPLL